jgi:hypothetical protein
VLCCAVRVLPSDEIRVWIGVRGSRIEDRGSGIGGLGMGGWCVGVGVGNVRHAVCVASVRNLGDVNGVRTILGWDGMGWDGRGEAVMRRGGSD